ncbi:hypothetical protein Acr_24g0012940 [Actinidia rufa]|uniref:Uncharacterized protein n=1 Tax=Actinidia rufa TaxID=165716 RepID=A0A7J0GX25_9ERIC|nr:hypothetical protein Acr_24g0012940 [Actinidia rufa]
MHFYALLNSFAHSPRLLTSRSHKEEPELLGGLFYQKSSARTRLGLVWPPSGEDTEDWFTTMTRFGSQMEQECIERGLVAVVAEESMSLLPIDFWVEACRHGLLLCSRR